MSATHADSAQNFYNLHLLTIDLYNIRPLNCIQPRHFSLLHMTLSKTEFRQKKIKN